MDSPSTALALRPQQAHIYTRVSGLPGVAATDGQPLAIRGQSVASGTVRRGTGIEQGCRAPFGWNRPDLSFTVEDQCLSVPAPVWRLHSPRPGQNDHRAPEIIFDSNRLQGAEENWLTRLRCRGFQLHVAELCRFHHVLVMRTNSDAGVERLLQMKLDRCTHLVQRLSMVA